MNCINVCGSIFADSAKRSKLGGKSTVTLNVDLWSINIKEKKEMFKVKFKLTMTWEDSRLNYINLKKDSYMNIVSQKQGHKIWLPPHIMFLNTEHLDQTRVS